jgi:phosphoribosylamine--glycine ligase
VLPRLATDLGALCLASSSGASLPAVEFDDDACVTVVLATDGYPESKRTGDVIEGIDAAAALPAVMLFHAGTERKDDGSLVTAGGRVLDVTAVGPTLLDARERAYAAAAMVRWPGIQYRHDIAGEAAAVSS